MSTNSFDARAELALPDRRFEIFRIDALQERFDVARLPFSLKILLENLLRTEGNGSVTAADIEAIARWEPRADPSGEIAFSPARVLMQDFTGVPVVVDLAAMRDAIVTLGGDPAKINPLVPAELVIDHSVQVDAFGSPRRIRDQRGARVRAQRRALRVPALGAAGVPRDSRSCRPTPGSSTRSTSSTSRASSSWRSAPARRRSPTPTRSSGPTRTRRW